MTNILLAILKYALIFYVNIYHKNVPKGSLRVWFMISYVMAGLGVHVLDLRLNSRNCAFS